MTLRAPDDQSERDRLRTEFDRTFFVQAGAGTGKTREVVERIVALAAAGRLDAARLVAITFTEAAAAELRARIREGLEGAAREVKRSAEQRERCGAVARAIDEASIDTIHAFARALLRTYPLEAGLPPNFEMLDEIEQEIDFEDHFRAWFDAVADDASRRDTVRRALMLGMTPDDLAKIARGLHENHDLLSRGAAWDPVAKPASPIRLAHELGSELVALAARIPAGLGDESICHLIRELQFAAVRLSEASGDDEALGALRLIESIDGRKGRGNQATWEGRVRGGGALLRCFKDALDRAEAGAKRALDEHRGHVLTGILDALRDFVLEYAAERKRKGVATFHDLLTWARDLLLDHADVRRRGQARWSRIFVDEFQDTDPLQAEIAFYLSAEPAAPGGPAPHWSELRLVPGKLCLVGDPKQSIYRFRRADVALYQRVQERLPDQVGLTQNFRSVPLVVDWVNHHYASAITHDPGVQPAYAAISADPADTGTGVSTFGTAIYEKQPEVWLREADDVARAARTLVEQKWQVSEGSGSDRRTRAARYSDVCVLIPTRTNLRRLERAFDRQHVPYRLESGELIVATQEVRDLVSCLRSIDDPSDQVALVAALRSPAYGCSDPELLTWVESGGPLAYEGIDTDARGDRVRAALTDLERFHRRRHAVTVPALIEEFVRSRLLVAAGYGQSRPREVWRRYRYLVARARAFAETGRTSLRSFVDWIEGIERDQVRGVSPAIAESDEEAVRVLTVHGAKGLEFPVVILTGWGSKPAFRAPPVITDRVANRIEVGIGAANDRRWTTARFDSAAANERALFEAEGVRLSYVASTRARDHLVVSLWQSEHNRAVQSAAFAGSLETFPRAVALELRDAPVPAPEARVAAEADVDAHRRDEDEWTDRRATLVEQLGGLRLRTATGLTATPAEEGPAGGEAPPEDVAAFRKGRGGTALGRAVHAVLQTVDLATLGGLDGLARAQADAEGIPHRALEVARLVRRACESEPVRRAVASGRYWREVPLGAKVDGTVLEGFVDLLYEEDGGLSVVDYKTDQLSAPEVEARLAEYGMQGGAYAVLVEKATRRAVSGVEFVFAAAGTSRRLADLDSLKAQVAALVADGAR